MLKTSNQPASFSKPMSVLLPIYSQKWTLVERAGMSVLCQSDVQVRPMLNWRRGSQVQPKYRGRLYRAAYGVPSRERSSGEHCPSGSALSKGTASLTIPEREARTVTTAASTTRAFSSAATVARLRGHLTGKEVAAAGSRKGRRRLPIAATPT